METLLDVNDIKKEEDASMLEENHMPRIKLENDPEFGATAIIKEENESMLDEMISDEIFCFVDTVDPLEISESMTKEVSSAVVTSNSPEKFCDSTEAGTVVKEEEEVRDVDDSISELSCHARDILKLLISHARNKRKVEERKTIKKIENKGCNNVVNISKSSSASFTNKETDEAHFDVQQKQSKIYYDSERIKLKNVSVVLENIIPEASSPQLTGQSKKSANDKLCSCQSCQRKSGPQHEPLKDLNVRNGRLSTNVTKTFGNSFKGSSEVKCFCCTVCPGKYSSKEGMRIHLAKHIRKGQFPFSEYFAKFGLKLNLKNERTQDSVKRPQFQTLSKIQKNSPTPVSCIAPHNQSQTLDKTVIATEVVMTPDLEPQIHTVYKPRAGSLTHLTSDCAEESQSNTVYGKKFDSQTPPTEAIAGHQSHMLCSTGLDVEHSSSHTSEKCVLTEKVQDHQELRTSRRTLSCTQCSEKFTDKKLLMRHIVAHTEDDPFSHTEHPKEVKAKNASMNHKTARLSKKPLSSPKCLSQCVKPSKEKQLSWDECPGKFGEKNLQMSHLTALPNQKPLSSSECVSELSELTEGKQFLCNQCSEKFKDTNSFKNHLATHSSLKPLSSPECVSECPEPSEDKQYFCSQCFKKFQDKNSLTIHLTTHSTLKPFLSPDSLSECTEPSEEKQCSRNECPAKFKDKNALTNPLTSYSKQKPFSGPHCLSECANLPEKRQFSCNECSATFKGKNSLRNHLTKHSNQKSLSDDCRSECVKSSNKKQFFCSVCPKILQTKWGILNHMSSHSNEKRFMCPHCPYRCKTKTLLQIHFQYKHSTSKPFRCTRCPAKFGTLSVLKAHGVLHTDAKPYNCDLCPARFKRKGDLTVHRNKHTGEAEFACTLCSFRFFRLSDFNKHVKSHSSERLFACAICPKTYKQKCHLAEHLLSHTGEKHFRCANCPRTFMNKHRLLNHLKNNCGKVYTCRECSAVFLRRDSLRAHMVTHTPGRRLWCAHCPLSFACKRNLRRHLKLIHSIDRRISCSFCPSMFHSAVKLKRHLLRSHPDE